MGQTILGAIVSLLLLAALLALVLGLPVMWLWNALLPGLFGFKTIGFWQAVGLNLLSGILFRPSISNSSK